MFLQLEIKNHLKGKQILKPCLAFLHYTYFAMKSVKSSIIVKNFHTKLHKQHDGLKLQ